MEPDPVLTKTWPGVFLGCEALVLEYDDVVSITTMSLSCFTYESRRKIYVLPCNSTTFSARLIPLKIQRLTSPRYLLHH